MRKAFQYTCKLDIWVDRRYELGSISIGGRERVHKGWELILLNSISLESTTDMLPVPLDQQLQSKGLTLKQLWNKN